MNLTIKPATGDDFRVRQESMTVRICIESQESLEVLGEPAVNTLLLKKQDEDDVVFGFSRSITRFPGAPILISTNHPFCFEADVLEYDEDLSGLTSGEYELRVAVSLFIRPAVEGEVQPHELIRTVSVFINR